MRRLFFGFFAGLWGIFCATPLNAAPPKMSLQECFEYALRRSETVAISEQEIAVARARYSQVLGSVLPKLSLNVVELLQDSSSQADGAGEVGSTFTQFSRPSVALTLTQPIFHGFKEFRALRLAKVNESRQRLLWYNAARLLYQDVVIAFLTIVKLERDIESFEQILRVQRSSLGELGERVRLGKSRDAEAALLKAENALLEAEVEQRRGQRQVAYDSLSFLTGLQPQPLIAYTDPPSRELKGQDYYAAQVEKRPDVQAARDAMQIARGEIKVRQGDLLPQADVTANYYPYRAGFQRDIKWDATFNVGIPIFNWETIGVIREAKVRAKQSELQEELTRRSAETEVLKNYDGYVSSLKQYQKFASATRQAQQSYGLQAQDMKANLITTLDLLQSQETWLDALRQRNTAEVQTWLDWLSLQVTAGLVP